MRKHFDCSDANKEIFLREYNLLFLGFLVKTIHKICGYPNTEEDFELTFDSLTNTFHTVYDKELSELEGKYK